MKLLQLIYTSCKKGQSTGAGFQTYSKSIGITDDEQLEIERCGVYSTPSDLPSQPDADQIRELFPVAFSFFRLKSGRYCICKSRYLGQDYSGRFGNFLAHAFVLQKGQFPIYPANFVNTSIFLNEFPPELDAVSEKPAPLPEVDMEEAMPNSMFTIEEITEKLTPGSVQQIKNMAAACINYKKSSRRIILCDEWSNVPYWMAATQMAFSLRLAHNITFTTYIYDPESIGHLICATSKKGSRFNFSENQRIYEYFICDNVEGFNSDSTFASEYAEQLVDVGFTLSPDNLTDVNSYIDMFEYRELDTELESAYNLYKLTKSGDTRLAKNDIANALTFATRYSSAIALDGIFSDIIKVSDKLRPNLDFELASLIIKFMRESVRQNGKEEHIANSYAFLMSSIDHFLLEMKIPDVPGFLGFFENHIKYFDHEYFIKAIFNRKKLDEYADFLKSDAGISRVEVIFSFFLKNISGADWQSIISIYPNAPQFIYISLARLASDEKSLVDALSLIKKDIATLVNIFTIFNKKLFTDDKSRHVQARTLFKILKNHESEYDVRLKLLESGNEDLIISEYYLLISSSNDARDFFWNYYSKVFHKNKQFAQRFFSSAANTYLEQIKGKIGKEEIEYFMKLEVYIDNELILKLINSFEKRVSFEKLDESTVKICSRINNIRKTRQFPAAPDISGLVVFLNLIYSDNENLSIDLAIEHFSPDYLAELDRDRFLGFLKASLPTLFTRIISPRDHYVIFDSFGLSKDQLFFEYYIKCLSEMAQKDKTAGMTALTYFIIYYLGRFYPKYRDLNSEHVNKLKKGIINAIYKMKKSEIRSIENTINTYKKDDLIEIGKISQKEWKSIIGEVEEMRANSFTGKAKRLFSKSANMISSSTGKIIGKFRKSDK